MVGHMKGIILLGPNFTQMELTYFKIIYMQLFIVYVHAYIDVVRADSHVM